MKESDTPSYIYSAPDTSVDPSEEITWVGIETTGPGGENKIYLWSENLIVDMSDENSRKILAKTIASYKMSLDVEVAVGMPVDLTKCDEVSGEVAIYEGEHIVGIYVEAEKRAHVNFAISIGEFMTEDDCLRKDWKRYRAECKKALDYLNQHAGISVAS